MKVEGDKAGENKNQKSVESLQRIRADPHHLSP